MHTSFHLLSPNYLQPNLLFSLLKLKLTVIDQLLLDKGARLNSHLPQSLHNEAFKTFPP